MTQSACGNEKARDSYYMLESTQTYVGDVSDDTDPFPETGRG